MPCRDFQRDLGPRRKGHYPESFSPSRLRNSIFVYGAFFPAEGTETPSKIPLHVLPQWRFLALKPSLLGHCVPDLKTGSGPGKRIKKETFCLVTSPLGPGCPHLTALWVRWSRKLLATRPPLPSRPHVLLTLTLWQVQLSCGHLTLSLTTALTCF